MLSTRLGAQSSFLCAVAVTSCHNDITYYAKDPRGGNKLANSWRITPDVIGRITLQDAALTDAGLADLAGPGGFNDPDMLLSSTTAATRDLTQRWSRTQFSVWAILMAPLLLGGPPSKFDAVDIQTYTNPEALLSIKIP